MPAMPTARSFWIRTPGHGEIVSAELPPRQAGEVLIRTRYSGISRGTEALVFRGAVPASQHAAMRAPFQEGDFPGAGQVRLRQRRDRRGRARSFAGPNGLLSVSAPGPLLRSRRCGPRGSGARAAVPCRAGRQHGDCGERRLGCAAGARRRDRGDRRRRRRVACRDPVPGPAGRAGHGRRSQPISRAAVAAALGLDVPPGFSAAVRRRIWSSTPAGSPDGVAGGAGRGRVARPRSSRRAGTVRRRFELPLGEAFHARRLTIRSSQVGHVPPDRAQRWSRGRRLELALALLADARLDALVSGRERVRRAAGRARWPRWPEQAGRCALPPHPLPVIRRCRPRARECERGDPAKETDRSCTASTSATIS